MSKRRILPIMLIRVIHKKQACGSNASSMKQISRPRVPAKGHLRTFFTAPAWQAARQARHPRDDKLQEMR